MIKYILKQIRRPIVFIPAIIVVLGIGFGIYHFATKSPVVHTTAAVERGTVNEEVSVVGRVQPTERLELSLQGSGRIAFVGTSEGARVKRGQTLVSLSADDLAAQLASAQAGLDQQQLRLNQLVEGSRSEDIAVTAATTDASRTSRDNAKRALTVQLRESFSSIDSTLGANIDQFYSNARTAGPVFGVSIGSGASRYYISAPAGDRFRLENQQVETVRLLNEWRIALGSGEPADLDAATLTGDKAVAYIQAYLADLASIVNSNRPDESGAAALYDGYKADVAASRAAVSGAASALSSTNNAYRAASSSLAVAESQFALKTAPAERTDVAIQQAAVRAAAAQVALVRANIAKNAIIAPVDGIVTSFDAKVGESASAAAPIITVMADAKLEIESKVPEADIAKISVGNMANVTLDAYPGETFTARVIYVAPAEVIVDNVATYKVKLQFEKDEAKIKPGMTADLDIATQTHENVLTVPQRAIVTKGGKKIVRVLDGDKVTEAEVVVGLRGVDGRTEIISGLSEGQAAITDSE